MERKINYYQMIWVKTSFLTKHLVIYASVIEGTRKILKSEKWYRMYILSREESRQSDLLERNLTPLLMKIDDS